MLRYWWNIRALVTQDEILRRLAETYVNPEIIKKYILEIRKGLETGTTNRNSFRLSQARIPVLAGKRRGCHWVTDLATAVTKEMVAGCRFGD